jgi:opacity protein-like surface antigen
MLSSTSRALAALLVLAACAHASAQTLPQTPPAQTPPPQTPPPQTAPPQAPPTPAQPTGPGRIQYGVRFGPSFTTLTSVEPFDDTAATAAFEPTLNFGGYAQIDLIGSLSFQPELLFAAKGHRIRDKDAQPISTPTGELKLPAADRVVLVRYLEFPLLLRLSKRTHENASLYLIGGPAFGLRRNAVIRQVSDAGRHEDIDHLVSGSNLSYIVGAGAQYRRWLVDARFTRGMRNIASDPAQVAVKTGAFSVLMGARF